MDLSKLPKLSETDKHTPMPPPGEPAQPRQAALAYESRPTGGDGVAPQVWISIVVGVMCMMMGWNFARFCAAKISGNPFNTNVNWTSGPKAGQPVEYYELSGYTAHTETGLFLFGLACVLEGLLLMFARTNSPKSRGLVMVALAIAFAATAFNLVVVILLFRVNIMPLTSLLCVAFGGYMVLYEWQMLQQMWRSARA